MTLAFWWILIGILCNVSCALLGCYLVLRRLSLLGDAISHAVLPGIVLAFVLSGQVTGLPIMLGAMVLGVLTAFLTQTLHQVGKVPEDSSMGVVYTALFALGVLLLQNAAHGTDLDPNCVLYGLLEYASIDTFDFFGFEVPRAVPTLGTALLLTVGFVLVFWKELKIVSFDPGLAAALGINATLVHYLLMAMVAGVTVAAFDAVGSILVVAMLIVPAATAQLLTDRLAWMLVWAAVVGVVSAVGGYLANAWLETNLAAMMAVAAGLQFLLAVLLAPRHGVVARLVRNARLSLRIACEDVLAYLYRREETAGPAGERGVAPGEIGRAGGRLARWLARPGCGGTGRSARGAVAGSS
jgi:manganese/zinc/iron transport system permease protein